MKFYFRLALDGMRKNKKLYLPYLFAGMLTVATFYILAYLSTSDVLGNMPGGDALAFTMNLGSFVIGAFSVLFTFYTNSFLMRRRKKEFGLYSVLGMDRKGIIKILAFEFVCVLVCELASGLFFGILFSKLCEFALCKLAGGEVVLSFFISFVSVRNTVLMFVCTYLLVFLNSVRQIIFTPSSALIKSENYGDRPPKANWILGILGIVMLAVAYYMAVSIDNPIDALLWFFVAVIAVIAATYILFISGSVTLCRILQKNKKYYYKKNHFISVSSMAYRMKRNGAGLASICILLTMVLVMISSTACLYFGSENNLRVQYPNDIHVFIRSSKNPDELANAVKITADGVFDGNKSNINVYRDDTISGLLTQDEIFIDSRAETSVDFSYLIDVHFVCADEFLQNSDLKDGEAIVYSTKQTQIPSKIQIGEISLDVKGTTDTLDILPLGSLVSASVFSNVFFIVPSLEYIENNLINEAEFDGESLLTFGWHYGFDTDLDAETQIEKADTLSSLLAQMNTKSVFCESRENNRGDFYGTYGGFFFLGIVLSIIFLISAVLIIYYKQLSEGYEDVKRFEIMQNVGMTEKDIRSSINSQMLTVFFLPMLFSAIHLAFAFPMIRKLLLLFNLTDLTLLITTTVISIIMASLLYILVYKKTSDTYFKIVKKGN